VSDLEDLIQELRAEPALREVARRAQRRDLTKAPLTPGRVREEQLVQALLLAMKLTAFTTTNASAISLLNGLGHERSALMFAQAVSGGVPYLWRRDLVLLARSMPLPRHVLGADLFPHDAMYWTMDRELLVVNPEPAWTDVRIQAWTVVRGTSEYVFGQIAVGSLNGTPQRTALSVEVLPFGSRYPQDIHGGVAEDLLKMAAFLNSPFVDVRSQRFQMTHSHRRRLGPRIGDPVALNVVTLRAEVREAVRIEAGEGPRWKQRWIVRGHYRAQFYPSTRLRRPGRRLRQPLRPLARGTRRRQKSLPCCRRHAALRRRADPEQRPRCMGGLGT